MGKKLGLLVAVAILAAIAVPAFAQGAFQDVPTDHWAYQAVDKLAQAGLIEGYPDGTFKGNRAMTRYEFAMVVARALESKALAGAVGPAGPAGPPGPAGTGGGAGLTPEQQALLNKLQNEFAPELKRLRDDLSDLEGRVAALEGKPLPGRPKITVSGDISLRTGLYGTKVKTGASDSTGYPYPGIGGDESFDFWFAPAMWGGINIPVAVDGTWSFFDGFSIPISDALKDSFKAPDFMTMRSRVVFNGDLGSNVSTKVAILADTRGNLFHPVTDVDDVWFDREFGGAESPASLYSDGLMDTLRVDEAWVKYSANWIRPWTLTAGKQYWGFGQGLLVNNSQHPVKSGKLDIALTGDAPGNGITLSAVLGMLDREAFSGKTANMPRLPDPEQSNIGGLDKLGGQDNYNIFALDIPVGNNWKVNGTWLASGFGSERGWSVDLTGKIIGLDLWGEWAKLTRFPDGSTETGATNPVDLKEADTAWLVGLGWNSKDFAVTGQYGLVEPLYAIAGFDSEGNGKGWDPVGLAASISGDFDIEDPIGYLNLPLSLLHPVEEFNPHFINWLDRPLFLDPTNVAKGWEVGVTLKRLLGENTPVSLRMYDGKAYSEEYLGWLFTDGGATMSKPDKWRDADAVWSVTLTHKFTDALSGSLSYGQREVKHVMSPNNSQLTEGDIQDDAIKVVRADLSVAF